MPRDASPFPFKEPSPATLLLYKSSLRERRLSSAGFFFLESPIMVFLLMGKEGPNLINCPVGQLLLLRPMLHLALWIVESGLVKSPTTVKLKAG